MLSLFTIFTLDFVVLMSKQNLLHSLLNSIWSYRLYKYVKPPNEISIEQTTVSTSLSQSNVMIFWLNQLNQRKCSQKSLKRWLNACSSCSLPSAAMRDSGKQRGLWQTTCSERIVGMSYCTVNSWSRSCMRVPWGERLEREAVLGELGVGWSRWGGLVEMVAEVVAVCGICFPDSDGQWSSLHSVHKYSTLH